MTITARSGTRQAPCPGCGSLSGRIHGGYQRRLADAAVAGRRTVVDLLVRRFVCPAAACMRKTFVEQVAGLTERYARRTRPLRGILETIALALSGRAGARLTESLSIPIGANTLIRLVRKLSEQPACPTPRVLGVDDFSLKRVIYSRPKGVLDVVQPSVSPGDLRRRGGYLPPSETQNFGRDHACSASDVAVGAAGVVDGTW
jgi:hypothetical protein